MPTSTKINQFNGDRIEWSCNQYGVTVRELADHLSMTSARLHEAIHGDRSLTMNQLQKIAEFFHRDLLFFFENGTVDAEDVDSTQFRTINSQKPDLDRKTKILVKRAEEQRNVFVDLIEDEEDYPSPRWINGRLSRNDQESIEDFALRTRQWLRLDVKNSFDSYRRALEAAGILVFVSNGYAGDWQIEKTSSVRGFSLWFDSYPVIVTKKQDSPAAQTFTLIHELGHLLLHGSSFIDDESDLYGHRGREREANEFAGLVLVPKFLLNGLDLRGFPADTPDQYDTYLLTYRSLWGVSGDVIVRRLREESLLSQHQYESYVEFKRGLPVAEKVNRGGSRHRNREPLHIFGTPFVSAVFDALHGEQITLTKASKYLDNLKLEDLRKLEESIVHI